MNEMSPSRLGSNVNRTVNNVRDYANAENCVIDIPNQISTFVEDIRREQTANVDVDPQPSTSARDDNFYGAKDRADRAVIEAEKFKAAIASPQVGPLICYNNLTVWL